MDPNSLKELKKHIINCFYGPPRKHQIKNIMRAHWDGLASD